MTPAEIINLARAAGMHVYEGDMPRVAFDGSIVDALTEFYRLAYEAGRREAAPHYTPTPNEK